MRTSFIILTSIITCFSQAGRLYDPTETRKQIIDYYRSVEKAWIENDRCRWRFKEVVDPLKGASEFLKNHIDQLTNKRYDKDRIERYIKRINRLHTKIFRWLSTTNLTQDSFSCESDFVEETDEDNNVLTPNYQNLSEGEFDYSYEEIN